MPGALQRMCHANWAANKGKDGSKGLRVAVQVAMGGGPSLQPSGQGRTLLQPGSSPIMVGIQSQRRTPFCARSGWNKVTCPLPSMKK